MDDETPQTRDEARELGILEPIAYTSELTTPAEFLPLNARRGLFLLGIAALFAGPLLAVEFAEYGDALIVGGNMLAAVGLGTALANPTR